MPRTRDELTTGTDYRYLNCDEPELDDAGVPTGRPGVFYGTVDELNASVAGVRGIVEQAIPYPTENKELIASGVGLTRTDAQRICDALTEFTPVSRGG